MYDKVFVGLFFLLGMILYLIVYNFCVKKFKKRKVFDTQYEKFSKNEKKDFDVLSEAQSENWSLI